MVHDDGEDGAEEEADEGDGDGATDERGDEPDDELEPEREEEVEEDDAPFAELCGGVGQLACLKISRGGKSERESERENAPSC